MRFEFWTSLRSAIAAAAIVAPTALAVGALAPSAALADPGPAVGVSATTSAINLNADSWLADPAQTPMSSVNQLIGAPKVWASVDSTGRTVTGKGVGVALVDSGITPVKGLSTSRVVNGPDLSFDSQSANLRNLDLFGHGTHLAGIIGGRDPEVVAGSENNPAYFTGVAPDTTLVNLKVASGNGSVDVSQVLAAIDWAVVHRNDVGLNIRVLNLSFGTDSLQDPRFDPLSFAVENAWQHGIVVVVAAGNDGPSATRLGMPAMNAHVIAVGAADHVGTPQTSDDVVADFSSRGSTTRHPDLVAPGRSVVSLRDPNSYLDILNPTGLLSATSDPGQRYFRGSGTSQAAAVVSGAAALLLQQRPNLTPDQVKRLLMTTAKPMPAADSVGQGAGQLDVGSAAIAATPWYIQPPAGVIGTGSLEQARGTVHVTDATTGIELTGERDIMGRPFSTPLWVTKDTSGYAWSGGTWNASTWAAGGWRGAISGTSKTWNSTLWTTSWSGTPWLPPIDPNQNADQQLAAEVTWDGRTWSGRTWSGRTWSGRTWSGRTWSASIWLSQEAATPKVSAVSRAALR